MQMGAGVKQQLAAQADRESRSVRRVLARRNRSPRRWATATPALAAGLAHYAKAVALDSGFAKAWLEIVWGKSTLFR